MDMLPVTVWLLQNGSLACPAPPVKDSQGTSRPEMLHAHGHAEFPEFGSAQRTAIKQDMSQFG
eukprot:356968-Chlamydomonas_euryale.AAC.15